MTNRSTVVSREYQVSDIKNVERLRAALRGEPLDMLNSSMIFSKSLSDALDQLRQTYGDPMRIIHVLEREIMQTEMVTLQGENLQKLLIKTRRLVSYVEACGYDDQLSNQSLLTKLEDKLPYLMLMRYADYLERSDLEPSLNSFCTHLQHEVKRSLKVGRNQVRVVGHKKPAAKKVVLTTMEVTEKASLAAKVSPTSPIPVCVVCKGAHRVVECPIFTGAKADDRLRMVEDHRLCPWMMLGV